MISFDLVVAAIFIIFFLRGIWIGFMRQLAAFLALVGSYWVAAHYNGQFMLYVDQFVDNQKLVFYISFAVLFFVSAIFFLLAGKVMHRVMEITLLGWFDRFLGLLLGGIKAVVVASLLYMFLGSSLSGTNDLLKDSISSPYLDKVVSKLHQLIRDENLQKYFIPKEPAILPESEEKKEEYKSGQPPIPAH